MSDETRKKILARRASFVAAALASVACGKEPQGRPEPCLAVPLDYKPIPADAGADSGAGEPAPSFPPPSHPPQPCLAPPPQKLYADAGAPPVDGPTPRPCLSVQETPPDAGRPPVPPRPCLTPKRPQDP